MPRDTVRVDHLAFPSFDAAATHRFYTEVMGFRLTAAVDGVSPEWGNKPYLMATFESGETKIHFFALGGMRRPQADGLPKDIRHFALSVKSRTAIAAWKKRLRAHRVPYWVEDHDGDPSVYFADPNGVTIEITHHGKAAAAPGRGTAAEQVIARWTTVHGTRGGGPRRSRNRSGTGARSTQSSRARRSR